LCTPVAAVLVGIPLFGSDEVGLSVSVVEGVTQVPAGEWDALVDPNDPFLEHAFLAALERSKSVGRRAGWLPRFVLVHDAGTLVGAVPLYLKNNSYGEFIFDWAWASAAMRSGLAYYPKLVAAVPFTPVSGGRLLVRPGRERGPVLDALCEGIRGVADDENASSIHVLFCSAEEAERLGQAGFRHRLSMQFHWVNRTEPYRDFEDFLGAFRSRNRKQVRKERATAAGHGLRLATLEGPALGAREWAALEHFYDSNLEKHGSPAYLTPEFFALLRTELAHRVVATFAYRGDQPVAGTLNFERGRHLYGRYWGCLEERDMLHFELCYYQLIERAIGKGHARFEAGAQGEHKLKRGLDPALTHSAHWIRDPDFARAVHRFIDQEALAMKEEVTQYQALSPYRRAGEPTEP
jgi:predicted N-acyltransferase